VSVFDSLLLAHLLGDWILQTEWQATNKQSSWRAMFSHVVVYHLAILVALWLWYGFDQPLVYIVVAGLAVSHAILDRRWPVIALMRALRSSTSGEPEKWLLVVFDQCLHILLLGVSAVLLARYCIH